MAHRTGLPRSVSATWLLTAGFPTVSVRTENFEVWCLALMSDADGDAIQRTLLESGFSNFQEARV